MALPRLSEIPYRWLVAIVFVFGMFMDLMDTTVVNVAIPKLTQEFHTTTSTVEWTVTGYLLSLAVFIPAAGFLSDRLGTKRVFLTAMAIFVVASAACGQARSVEELVLFRFVQGVGGGMMTPVGTAMLSREFPGVERARASAIISIPVVLAPTVGPVVGGYLTEYASWRWIFYVNLPVGVAGFLLGLRVLHEHKEEYAQGRIDILGLITGGAGAAMTLYAVSEAANRGWTSSTVMGFGLGGLALMALFAAIELIVPNPVLDLRLFKRWLFASGNLMMMPAFGAFGGFILLLTLFLQELQGYSPLQAGLIQAPSTVGTAISLPLASRLYPRIGPRRMLLFGFFFAAVTMLPFLTLQLDSPAWYVVILLLLRGLPFAFAAVASQTILYGPLESSKQGAASSIYNTLRQVAASFGVALIITVAINRTNAHAGPNASAEAMRHAAVLGYHEAFLAAFALLAIPFFLAFTIDDRKAAETLRQRMETVRVTAEAAGGGGS
ncbi:MAG TPA: DHA2 family efflux MFS transporter permease subunit [Dehalococcoidia bacterium]|nr:DHA2 family efflux MFS transporter permease subunit [Dehalococcoidia bacterium]